MLKKLAVPFLTLALATLGCSSSTTPNGTGGSGGGAGTSAGGKGGGAAGTNGTAGEGGHSGGGAAGSSAAGTNGTAGGGGHSGGGNGGAKADAGTSMADCTDIDSTGSDVLTPTIFCENFLAYCTGVTGFTVPAGYENQAACEASYGASNQQHCRSYHLCWGVEGLSTDAGSNPMVHCKHTVGMGGLCANTDASTGN